MKLLIIMHEFTPARSPRAYRWGAIAEQLARDGHQIDVVCSWKPGLPRHESGPVCVERVGDRLAAHLRQQLAKPPSAGASRPWQSDPIAPPRASLLAKAAAFAYYRLWKLVYWPDAQCLFMPPALRAARRLLSAHTYDALITVSLPFCCHLVGLALKRSNPNLRWIVDIGDPFALLHDIPLNNHRLYARLNRRAEAAVLRRADHVAMTTRGAWEEYRREFDLDIDKVSIIPPLQSLPSRSDSTRVRRSGTVSDAVRIVYCGRLYNDIRSPQYLLKLWQRLNDLKANGVPAQLHFYGEIGDCAGVFEPYRAFLGERLFLHGQVERPVIAAALAEADVLANIGNSTSHQLPSKIVEYIGMGKPILNLVSHARDCTLELLADHPATLNLRTDVDDLETNAGRAAQLIERLPIVIPATTLAALQAPFLTEAIAGAYTKLATNSLAGRRTAKAA